MPPLINTSAELDMASRQGSPDRNHGSAGNALKHGLSATKLLPQVLSSDRVAELREQLVAEYRPGTITARLLISEMARHAAALELIEEAEPAVRRQAVVALNLATQVETAVADWQLTAAVTNEPLDRCARYRRTHEKGFYQALAKLTQLTATPGDAATSTETSDAATTQITSTSDCEQYLRQHTFSAAWRCPACKSPQGHWLETRQLWQCASCAKQYGLRQGTVFARSPLPLLAWFIAIRAYAAQTDIDVSALSQATGITRLATVRAMLARIRQAVEDDDLACGLAGLTRYPLVLPPPQAEQDC